MVPPSAHGVERCHLRRELLLLGPTRFPALPASSTLFTSILAMSSNGHEDVIYTSSYPADTLETAWGWTLSNGVLACQCHRDESVVSIASVLAATNMVSFLIRLPSFGF